MKNMDDVIQNLYNNLLNIITKGANEDEKKLIEEQYMTILKNRYLNFDIELKKANAFVNNYNEIYENLYESEYNEWSKLSIDMKKHFLLNDSALRLMLDITSESYKLAQNRLNKNIFISSTLANRYINELYRLYESVKDYNKPLANWYLSEGTLDLQYASGQTDNVSMRIGHIRNFN